MATVSNGGDSQRCFGDYAVTIRYSGDAVVIAEIVIVDRVGRDGEGLVSGGVLAIIDFSQTSNRVNALDACYGRRDRGGNAAVVDLGVGECGDRERCFGDCEIPPSDVITLLGRIEIVVIGTGISPACHGICTPYATDSSDCATLSPTVVGQGSIGKRQTGH